MLTRSTPEMGSRRGTSCSAIFGGAWRSRLANSKQEAIEISPKSTEGGNPSTGSAIFNVKTSSTAWTNFLRTFCCISRYKYRLPPHSCRHWESPRPRGVAPVLRAASKGPSRRSWSRPAVEESRVEDCLLLVRLEPRLAELPQQKAKFIRQFFLALRLGRAETVPSFIVDAQQNWLAA